MLEELGVAYRNVPVDFIEGSKRPDYLEINPNGRVPALDDDGLVLFESLAINLHLARKYGADNLWPSVPDDWSRAIQWSIWSITEVEAPIVKVFMNRLFLPEQQRIEAAAMEGERELASAIGILEGRLRGRPYLLGDSFSVADLNVYSMIAWDHPALRTPYLERLDPKAAASLIKMDLSQTPHVHDWARRCAERPGPRASPCDAMRGDKKAKASRGRSSFANIMLRRQIGAASILDRRH